jgi:hypothetical protein
LLSGAEAIGAGRIHEGVAVSRADTRLGKLAVRDSLAEGQARKLHSDLENSTTPRPNAVLKLSIPMYASVREPNEETLFKVVRGGIEDSPAGVFEDAL